MLTLVWPFVVRVTAKPLVQGFLGAVLAVLLMWSGWQLYGVARWHLYGRNNQRIDLMQDKVDRMWNYLVAQEAAKQGGK